MFGLAPHYFVAVATCLEPRSLFKASASKLEEGDFKGAVRLASFEDILASLDMVALASLEKKDLPPSSRPYFFLYP